ncbi:zf-HC2 domain-containing protein [Actinomycetospora cinnamomea]|uniref:Putative zinc finger protein n=1 Tax=Actinomycetospora cinnamomea TaxID=663609 RepID=A0A2U1FRP8_9PSEU|nr:zf-HC2 domain-containing protein [Actinomycetospora cinnamomea]PVZ14848.1 putative zinc finger protein [Actinomycetospora cinnamomea]
MSTTPGGAGHPDDAGHTALRELLGAHVLGQLDDTERAAVDAHLHTCPSCRAERAALAPLAGPLAHVDPDPGPGTADEPTTAGFAALLDRLREEDREEDRAQRGPAPARPLTARPRLAARLAMVAAAVAIAAAGVGVGLAVGAAGEPPVESVPVQALDPAIRASAGAIDHTWGVEMVLTASGFTDGEVYEVTVLDRTGRPVPAGAFLGTGPDEMVCHLNSSVLRDQASGFVVTDADGDEVLRSRFT